MNGENLAQVSIAPPHAWLIATPSRAGKVSTRCSTSMANVSGRWSNDGDIPPPVVDRVVAPEQDPPVVGAPVVVELVAGVPDTLASGPPDLVPGRRAQRLGHHHVVVDRHEVVPQAAQQRREGVGGQRDPGGGHRAAAVRALGADAQPGAVVVEVESAGALVQPDPVGQRDAPQAPRQPGGVDHRDPVAVGRPRRGRAASARARGPPRRTGTPPCRRTARRAAAAPASRPAGTPRSPR